MWFDEDITLAIQTDPFINVSGTTSFSQISNVTVDLTEQPIIINLSENYAPVQSVNGKIGFVTITKEDLGITGSIVTSGDLSNYATITNLRLTGSTLNSQIDFLTGNVVFLTGSQIISGVKNFIFRPTVNGTGILLSGETPVLPSNIVFTDLNQFISGQKTFLIQPNKSFWVDSESLDGAHGYLYIDQDYSSFGYHNNQIRANDSNIEINGPVSFNDYLFLNNDLYSNSDLYANYLYINGIFDQEDASSLIEMHSGSIVLKPNAAGGIGYVSIEPPSQQYSSFVELRVQGNAYARNLVYTTGNQTVSGTKFFSGVVNINSGTFLTRPTVNGTGVLLSGEAASLPTTIVYTTGNQIKSGRLIIGNDAGSIVDPNSQYTLSLQTNSPYTWLEILNNSGVNQGAFFGMAYNDFEQYNWQGGDIKFFTSQNPSDGTVRLTIKNDGKVGIGNSYPSEKLDVDGNIKVSNSGFFASGIKVGNNSITITESRIDGGYNASNGNLTDGLLGIQYSGYFDNDPEWFTTANVKPIINQLSLYSSSNSEINTTYTQIGNNLNYFSGLNGYNIYYVKVNPEPYWYVNNESNYATSSFVTYDLETWVNSPDGPFGSVPPTATILETKNSENSINFNSDHGVINGTSWEWVGYFVPQTTSNHTFYLNADEISYFWIGDKALNGYTSGNADIYSSGSSQNSITGLTSGESYPVRLQWGHPVTPTSANLYLYFNDESQNIYDFSGLFFYGSVGKGFFIDAISGDASFAGNVQANSATFNTRPTVNGTGVLLSGEATNGGTANFRYAPVSGAINFLSNQRYSINTSDAQVTGVLPSAPQAGDEIELYDIGGAWNINPLIVDNNGNYIEQRLEQLECNVNHGLIKLIYTTANNIGWRIYPMPAHNVPNIIPPIPAIVTSTVSGYAPLIGQFSGINLANSEISPVDHWYWNVSGDSAPEFDQSVINYTFNETGTYTFYLTATNVAGSGTASGIFTVLEVPPISSGINYSNYISLLLHFNP